MSSPVQHARLQRLGFVALALVACSRRADEAVAPPDPIPAAAHFRELASPTAFELAPAPTGALLAWVRRGAGRVELERWDQAARSEGAARAARGPSVGREAADLVAVATEGGVALAWSETGGRGVAAKAAWIPPEGAAQTYDLGPASRPPVPSRGGLALAARGDGALLFARGTDIACVDASEEGCVAFNFFQLTAGGVAPAGIPLSVPSPCDSQAAQLNLESRGAASSAGAFDYAVCSNARGAPALTIFSIRTDPAYAMSREAFTGCTPLGAARFGGQAAFVATCGKYRRLALADARTGELGVQDGDERGLICRGGSALVRFGATWLRLVEPLGRLELLLSDDTSPPGSRAVWTGRALLVARADGARLGLSRYVCRDSSLEQSPADADAGP
jgi:hypothetical protein